MRQRRLVWGCLLFIYLAFFPVLDLYLFLGLSPWQRMDAVNVAAGKESGPSCLPAVVASNFQQDYPPYSTQAVGEVPLSPNPRSCVFSKDLFIHVEGPSPSCRG